MNMDIRPIRDEADYDWALAEIAQYFENEPAPGSDAGARFDVLSELIAAYENRVWPIEAPDPIQTIVAFMEARGRSQADLTALLGSKSRASEVLSKRRRLSLDMIQKLNEQWRIPAEIMIKPYHLEDAKRARKRA